MKTRPLGETGLIVTEVALGTWGLSGEAYGRTAADEAKRVMQRALTMGVNCIETASSYGVGTDAQAGAMEKALGEVLSGHFTESAADPATFTVVTRVGTDRTANPARKQFSGSFVRQAALDAKERIGANVNLVVLLHNPSPVAMQAAEATAALAALCAEGAIRSWGVSAGSQQVAEAALDAGAPVLSVAYNIFQVAPLRALAARIRAAKTGVLAHSVLAYGLLCGRWPATKVFPIHDHRSQRWPDGSIRRRIQQLDAVRPLVSGDITSMRSAALRFALQNDLISSVVLGPRMGAQLDQLLRDMQGEGPYLSEAKLSALEARLEHLGLR